ncbi:MAG: MATE family efflux transporter [Treponemataceae bacterium]
MKRFFDILSRMVLSKINAHKTFSLKESLILVWHFSIPAIIAQFMHIVMQYADSAMVSRLGSSASASIGLVVTSTWLFYGLITAFCSGFSVQVAQSLGAGDSEKTKTVVKSGFVTITIISFFLALLGSLVSFKLPVWLNASDDISRDASLYFLIFSISMPVVMNCYLCICFLQCAGRMKIVGVLSVLICVAEVAFNAFYIFILKWAVVGAALGTFTSELIFLVVLLYFVLFKVEELKPDFKSSNKLKLKENLLNLQKTVCSKSSCTGEILRYACKISIPMAFEQISLCAAHIMITGIVAPLGTISIAANSFGITAEALCYMPAYGIAHAATTIVGQVSGAGYAVPAKKFAKLCTAFGMIFIAFLSVTMYFTCPWIFKLLTPDENVRALSIQVLRSEIIAEPMFAAYVVASGALRGIGDTLVPAIFNLVSMWLIRVSLSWVLVKQYGLKGVWVAMCIELFFRGTLFLIRLFRQKFTLKQHLFLPDGNHF